MFIEKGFHQTGMRDIAGRAGISLGNLYNHFKGKEDIIAAIAEVEAESLEPILTPLENAEAPGLDLLDRFVSDYFGLTSTPAYAALSAEIVAELFRNPDIAQSFEATRLRLIKAVESCLSPGLGALDAELVVSLVESSGLNAVGKSAGEMDSMLETLRAFVRRSVTLN
ncbi:TetR/AcrR family transcriptional regulator [Roseibium sediminicola]|uniref:TetR/AcrR family transcriptional regulator n=1 Tax=Roseibium sediminicola TaxID=2933272 RepID=A0ABT0GS61_9HYPH|nr:TetR/AcrR family transcriptional regulator [Roseibium sp. CAU 1639]MCK7611623.1 TetR/AcrR family transcriptional regulator [Roseibium sp. CAU 1639]